MQLSRVAPPIDVVAFSTGLRRTLRVLGFAFLPPFVVALLAREWEPASALAAIAGGSALLGMRLGPDRRLGTQDGLALTAIGYLLFSVAGAFAYLPAASFLDGFFEAMSGFTTTGLGVLDVAELPKSLLFLRAYSQWLGGAGIIVLSIVFLPGARASLASLYAAEFREENLVGSILATARLVFIIYGTLTLAGFGAFVACGMGAFDALLYVLATVSTGGFSPHLESAGHFERMPIRLAIVAFMVAGAVAFPLYYRARKQGLARLAADPQLRALALFIAVGLGLALASRSDLVDSLFHVASAVTTTGFTVVDASAWSEGWRLGAIVLMIVGGSTGSTAGGIKIARVLVVLHVVTWAMKRTLLPTEAKLPIQQGERVIDDVDIKTVLGFVAAYVAVLALTASALTLGGYAPMDALFESTSALGTVGLSSGITGASMPAWAKLLLVVNMWAGRLEIFPLLVLFYPRKTRLGSPSGRLRKQETS